VIKVDKMQDNQSDATLQQMREIATARSQKLVQSDWTTTSESF